MEIYPILNKPGKGKYVFIFILNERAVKKVQIKYTALSFKKVLCFRKAFYFIAVEF